MKTTIVPAQITTVEDRVAGNLSFKQLILLIAPVFIGGAIFIALPPFAAFSGMKAVLASIVTLVFMVLAIRIKGRLIVDWLVVIGRYNRRSRYVVFDKNDSYLREAMEKLEAIVESADKDETQEELNVDVLSLSYAELVNLEQIVTNPKANFELKASKKGGLRVHINEVK